MCELLISVWPPSKLSRVRSRRAHSLWPACGRVACMFAEYARTVPRNACTSVRFPLTTNCCCCCCCYLQIVKWFFRSTMNNEEFCFFFTSNVSAVIMSAIFTNRDARATAFQFDRYQRLNRTTNKKQKKKRTSAARHDMSCVPLINDKPSCRCSSTTR